MRFAPNRISKHWNSPRDRNTFWVFFLLPNQFERRICDKKRSHPCSGTGSQHESGWVGNPVRPSLPAQVCRGGKAMVMSPSLHQQGVQAVSGVTEKCGSRFLLLLRSKARLRMNPWCCKNPTLHPPHPPGRLLDARLDTDGNLKIPTLPSVEI